MFKNLDFTNSDGLYIYQETLDWLQQAYSTLFDVMASFYGNKIILTGVLPAGGNVTDGWVIVDGQILPFVGGAVKPYCFVNETITNEQYNDGNQKPAYYTYSVKFSALATGTTFNYSDFVRLPLVTPASATLKDALNNIQTLFKGLINLENCVIVSGCQVTAVNTGAGTCSISAGVAFINGNIVAAPARVNQPYPCYLKPDGSYTLVDPGGDRISFDPYTSQYYVDVLKRKQHYTGAIIMSVNPNDLDYFDVATGLGKWRYLGWKLSDATASRVLVGYDKTAVDPNDGVWTADYHNPGHKDAALTNAKTIDMANLPAKNILGIANQGVVGAGGAGMVKVSSAGSTTATGFDSTGNGTEMNVHDVFPFPNLGVGAPIDTRMPFTTVLIFERL